MNNGPGRALLIQHMDIIDTVALRLVAGLMNSPLAPRTDDERLEASRSCYLMASTFVAFRNKVRATQLEQHGFAPELTI